jgi:FdhE protein
MSIEPADAIDPIVQRLCTLVQNSPDLKDAARLYKTILPLIRDADLRATPGSLTIDQARAKMKTGLPLLHNLDLELDEQAVCELMLQLARAVETCGENNRLRAAAARRIRLALEEERLSVSGLLPHIAAGKSGMVTSMAQGLQLDPGLVWTLAQNALKPALRAWGRQLAPLAEGIPWQKGSCFICGSAATLAELQENNQVKHLRCGQCGADWLFRRLQCVYCGNEDHHTLSYLYAENQRERMRVEVCDKCKGYLKVITAFAPTPPELLPVEDLATLHLDYIAQGRGYARINEGIDLSNITLQ